MPGHSFLPGNDAADELARRGALLALSAIPCSLSSLISRIHSFLFSDWRRTVSSKFFDTQDPSIFTEELVLPRHARCVFSRLRCNGHNLLLSSYFSRIGRIENPSCSACGHSSQDICHLIVHCPATDSLRRSFFGDSVCLSMTSGPSAGELPGFWGSMVFRHALIPRQGTGNNNNNKTRLLRQAAIHCSSLVPTELFLPAFKGNDIQMLVMCRNRGRCSKSWTTKQKRERNLKQLLKGSIKEQTRIQLG